MIFFLNFDRSVRSQLIPKFEIKDILIWKTCSINFYYNINQILPNIYNISQVQKSICMKQKNNYESYMDNREQKKHEMVSQTHKKNKQLGIFESINDIFYRLPLPRLEKSNYKFLFENIKENVEIVLEQENKVAEMQRLQQQMIDSMDVKLIKPAAFPSEEELYKEKLNSGNAMFRSLVYLRFQDSKLYGFLKFQGSLQPFLQQSHYIELQRIKKQIPNLKLFLEDEQPIKRHDFQFQNENQLVFKDKSFPSTYQFNKRAEVLAKLYLLDLYRDESRKLLTLDRNDEAELQKKRQINKIKQEMEIEKMKQGELIEDMDLLKQVYKILEWIQKKMNALAYEEFNKNKNGDRATQIKKSLEKLKTIVNTEPVAMNKLKILINYKYKKGF